MVTMIDVRAALPRDLPAAVEVWQAANIARRPAPDPIPPGPHPGETRRPRRHRPASHPARPTTRHPEHAADHIRSAGDRCCDGDRRFRGAADWSCGGYRLRGVDQRV